ncbi:MULTISPECIES: alpha/beta fold hydrolase [unclassified Arthrobacter]|uniref:alpha/beta fold hydrolase n=1 Tax=unclassified Arthrobacter TaxID=235627 RepID=UPI002E0775E8|nr:MULTISPECIES: alpha/beta hydrolase [unclassified Arthrobacter]MEC5192412.1 pimeloyl-ACP methyl ester carboxylesterase [Arthrobacter sp. MP_M4]MEC5203897.1 pimeloyl-ACP methyl ester carboxylesterase [Arthrobacter sp. MP_M7]
MAVEPLAYLDTGGDFPAIVFIHGMTFSKETWDPIIYRIQDRFRCLAIDLPGHGGSLGSGADPHDVVARLHATIADSGVVRPVIVGHSAGALHATAYAAFHESAGVLNVDQSTRVAPFAGFLQQLAPALRGPDFADAFAPFAASIGIERLPEPEQGRVLTTQRIDQQLVLDYWSKPLSDTPTDLQSGIDMVLDRVTAPYLWLAGGPVEAADREHLLAHVPQARIETWSNMGHMAHLAEPDKFAARVSRFLIDSE